MTEKEKFDHQADVISAFACGILLVLVIEMILGAV